MSPCYPNTALYGHWGAHPGTSAYARNSWIGISTLLFVLVFMGNSLLYWVNGRSCHDKYANLQGARIVLLLLVEMVDVTFLFSLVYMHAGLTDAPLQMLVCVYGGDT